MCLVFSECAFGKLLKHIYIIYIYTQYISLGSQHVMTALNGKRTARTFYSTRSQSILASKVCVAHETRGILRGDNQNRHAKHSSLVMESPAHSCRNWF